MKEDWVCTDARTFTPEFCSSYIPFSNSNGNSFRSAHGIPFSAADVGSNSKSDRGSDVLPYRTADSKPDRSAHGLSFSAADSGTDDTDGASDRSSDNVPFRTTDGSPDRCTHDRSFSSPDNSTDGKSDSFSFCNALHRFGTERR